MTRPFKPYLIICLLLYGLHYTVSGQSYTFSPGINYVFNMDTSTADFGGIEIVNTGSQNLNLTWKQSLTDTLADSRFELCNSGICFMNLPHSGIMPAIAPGNKGWLKFHMYSGVVTGTNTIKYILKNGIAQVDTLTFHIIVSSPTAIKEASDLSNMSLYPNPATKESAICFSLPHSSEITVSVLNNLGQSIYQTSSAFGPGSNKIMLDTEHFPPGLYHVLLATDKGSVIKKLCVTK